VVEGTTLEMWRMGNCTVGSNPTLSAKKTSPASVVEGGPFSGEDLVER
jgi:hypothetical protein